jgi:predicted phosphodiesterase
MTPTHPATVETFGPEIRPNSIHILHISDIHLGTPAEARRWHTQLAEDLVRDMKCDRLDALIISGDVANQSEPKEYEAAKILLDLLCEEFHLHASQLVIVPGNHDLNWGLSERGYRPVYLDKLRNIPEEGSYIRESDKVVRLRNEEKYKERFRHFSNFYRTVKSEPYPPDHKEQGILHHIPQANLLILGLNSCWQIDHHFTSRAGVSPDAVAHALDRIRRDKSYQDCQKFAVWHHPLNSPFEDRIRDHGFMEQLAKGGFHVCMHGHLHKAEAQLYLYDRQVGGRRIHIIAAGTFGAPVKEWTPGYPLQYNLLKLSGKELIVETRRREEIDGAWKPDARWTQDSGKDPLPRYNIDLSVGTSVSLKPNSEQKAELVSALLECAAMRDWHIRAAIVNELNSDIRNTIQRHPADRVDVSNIVSRCMDFADGISTLITILKSFEGNSICMRQLESLLKSMD